MTTPTSASTSTPTPTPNIEVYNIEVNDNKLQEKNYKYHIVII